MTQPGATITAHLAVTGTTNYLVIDTYASPQPLRWAVSGAGTWDTSSINWTNNFGTPTAFTSGDQVRFDETYITAPTTVTLDTAVTPVSVTVSNVTHNYTISGSGDYHGRDSPDQGWRGQADADHHEHLQRHDHHHRRHSGTG